MKNWTTEGHLSDLALERWAAGETEAHETGAIQGHLETCEACRAQETEWQGLFYALASLEPVEPSASFDTAVMEALHQGGQFLDRSRDRLGTDPGAQ